MIDADTLKTYAGQIQTPQVIGDQKLVISPPGWNKVAPDTIPAPTVLRGWSLAGVAAYLAENRDKLDLTTISVAVGPDQQVVVQGPIEGEEKKFRRAIYVVAAPMVGAASIWGQWTDLDVAIINLQVTTMATPELTALLSLLSSIRENSVRDSDDDGFAQEVTTTRGIAVKNRTAVPNPVTLTPYRTFRDIEQPSSPFLIRLKATDGGRPMVLISEADGGLWRYTAVSAIVQWLKENTKGIAIIG